MDGILNFLLTLLLPLLNFYEDLAILIVASYNN